MDIVIYTRPEILLEKLRPDCNCHWTLTTPPLDFAEGDLIFFATKGEVRGSFECVNFDPDDEETVQFPSNTWRWEYEFAAHVFCRPFQGFKYRWWPKEEGDEKES